MKMRVACDIAELQTLVEQDNYAPGINSTYFPNAPLRDFWSSSPSKNDGAWHIWFSLGYTDNRKMIIADAVRMVRGG
ncbi:MAG: DUF1566 domain-containing protein [Methylococcales bacterium]